MVAVLETFVPLRDWLQRSADPFMLVSEAQPEPQPEAEPAPLDECAPVEAAIDEVKRFQASLADTLEMCVAELMSDIACDILARELLLAPCEVSSIVRRAISSYGADAVRIRVHPEDAPMCETSNVPIVPDDSLRRGDAVIEARHGTIDASLGVRLERVLARFLA